MVRIGFCRCCGVSVLGGGVREHLRVCIGCDLCDELHGDKLQAVLAKGVADGKVPPYTALTRMLIDDAQLTNRLEFVVFEGQAADLRVNNPPPRWMVVAGRALARGEQPDLQSLVGAVLGRYFGKQSTAQTLHELRLELCEALSFVDASIFDVKVSTKMDTVDPGHLMIEVQAKTPTLGVEVAPGANELIPADIMNRKRAEA